MQQATTNDNVQQQLAQLANRSFTIGDVAVNYRPIIAWALNDRLEPGPLTEQLLSFKRAGYGGIMLEVWRGCPYAVMSDEWLDMVGFILKLAKREDLEVWIWDDWVFPSGPAGGVVTRDNDDFKSKVLKVAIDVVLEPGEEIDLRVPARSLVAALFPVDKFNNPCGAFRNLPVVPGETIRYTAATRERLVIIRWQLVSTMQNTPKSQMEHPEIYTSDDPDVFSVDMLNTAAVRRFIEVIHERYWERYSEYFGNTFKGFFFDEPGLPNIYPWTEGFAEEFRTRKGYDLLEHLAPMLIEYKMYDIVFDLQGEELKRIKADYIDVWTSVMAEKFYGQIQAWCHEHGVISTGHQGNDESLKPLVAATGQHFKNMFFNDMPGTDVVFSQLDPGAFVDFPRLAGSCANVQGKPAAISESFAVTGHGMDIDALRYIAEHQIIRGVNKFFNMMANYNPMRGLYFHPPELSDINLLLRKYGHHLHNRMGNLCSLLSSGKAPTKTALFVPMENYYRGENGIAADLDALAQLLTYHQQEFDYIWDEAVLDLSAQDGSLVSAGGQQYAALLLPPGARLTDALRQRLITLAKSGCRLLAWETVPAGLEHCCTKVADAGQLIELVADRSQPFTFPSEETPVSLARRILSADRQLVFLLNESTVAQELALATGAKWQVYAIDPESLAMMRLGGPGEVSLRLEGTESRLLLLDATEIGDVPACPQVLTAGALNVEQWELELPDGQSAQISMPLPSWNALGYPEYHGSMRYRATFTWAQEATQALLNLGDLRYAATVYLDGELVGDCLWTPRCIVLSGLKPGEHRLEIDVLNTMANLVCGTDEQYQRLEESGAFRGTYFPIYLPRDKQRVTSGLFGPVTISPVN